MVSNSRNVVFVFGALVLLAGCRNPGQQDARRCGLLGLCPVVLPAPADPLVPADSGGKASIIMLELERGPQNDYIVSIQPEDTLNLLSEWSGLSLDELAALNPTVKHTGLVAGAGFNLRLSTGAWKSFNGRRNGYRAGLLEKRARGVEVVEVVKHVVRKGETLENIASSYATTVDLVEKFNPRARGLALYAGDEILVPIIAGAGPAKESAARQKKSERLPGPPAPSPTPVPVPPGDSRRLLVDSP